MFVSDVSVFLYQIYTNTHVTLCSNSIPASPPLCQSPAGAVHSHPPEGAVAPRAGHWPWPLLHLLHWGQVRSGEEKRGQKQRLSNTNIWLKSYQLYTVCTTSVLNEYRCIPQFPQSTVDIPNFTFTFHFPFVLGDLKEYPLKDKDKDKSSD